MVNRSNFPNAVDQFNILVDILSSDKTNVQRYQTLLMQETRTTAEETELINLKNTLKNKIISSEHINFITDSITTMQDYYLNEVVAHLATLDVGTLRADIGSPTNLTTTNKIVVNAINEVNTKTGNHIANTNDPHQSYAQAKTYVDTNASINRGQKNSTDDINWLISNGSYQVVNVGNLHSSFPSGAEADGSLVVFDGGDSNTQLYFGKTTGIYQRTRIGLEGEFTWTGWQKLVTSSQGIVWNLTLESGWVNYQVGMEGRFYADQMGRVWLDGRFKNGASTDGASLATMPDGYKPLKDQYFKARNCDVLIDTTGVIRLYSVSTPGDIGIDGLSYKVF